MYHFIYFTHIQTLFTSKSSPKDIIGQAYIYVYLFIEQVTIYTRNVTSKSLKYNSK